MQPFCVQRNNLISSLDHQLLYELFPGHQETRESKGIVSKGRPSYPVTLQPEDHFTLTVAVLIYNELVWPQECKIQEKLCVEVAIRDANVNKKVDTLPNFKTQREKNKHSSNLYFRQRSGTIR